MKQIISIVLGLCLGSFVNALVWRLRQKELVSEGKGDKKLVKQLSRPNSRSMCPNCHHTLSVADLVPVVSWIMLGGKCRYCKKPISWQYPVVELATAALFVFSYIYWPVLISGTGVIVFSLWLIVLTGLVALSVYDIKYMILPNSIIAFSLAIAILMQVFWQASSVNIAHQVFMIIIAALLGSGLFYAIFQLSGGKWIGGGDVKLAVLLGVLVADPAKMLLVLFLASLGGTLFALPMLATGKSRKKLIIPFGPFLIFATYVTVLFGTEIISWYQRTFLVV